jgi:hypothetical protein
METALMLTGSRERGMMENCFEVLRFLAVSGGKDLEGVAMVEFFHSAAFFVFRQGQTAGYGEYYSHNSIMMKGGFKLKLLSFDLA